MADNTNNAVAGNVEMSQSSIRVDCVLISRLEIDFLASGHLGNIRLLKEGDWNLYR